MISFPKLPLAIGAVVTVGAMLGLDPPVQAQDSSAQAIVVTAPRQVGRTSTGAPIESVTVVRHVSYRDLDLRAAIGVAKLNQRVSSAANGACRELEQKYPIGEPDAVGCAKQAVADAKKQVDAAIASAKGG